MILKRGTQPASPAYRITWIVFACLLLFAVIFVLHTAPTLPPMVASHFDTSGEPNAFMPRARYIRFVLLFALVWPIGLVIFLRFLYSRATDMKLPNRDYWLAPERIARTRAFLIAHGVWFASLMAAMVCFVHWLELGANRHQPPHLSNLAVGIGLVVFFIATGAWIATVAVAFRRRPGPQAN